MVHSELADSSSLADARLMAHFTFHNVIEYYIHYPNSYLLDRVNEYIRIGESKDSHTSHRTYILDGSPQSTV